MECEAVIKKGDRLFKCSHQLTRKEVKAGYKICSTCRNMLFQKKHYDGIDPKKELKHKNKGIK